jgi:hypothetical protein
MRIYKNRMELMRRPKKESKRVRREERSITRIILCSIYLTWRPDNSANNVTMLYDV